MEPVSPPQPNSDNTPPHTPGETYHPESTPPPQQPSQPVPNESAPVTKPKSSVGKSVVKTLLWIILLILIGIVGALAAIYIFKI